MRVAELEDLCFGARALESGLIDAAQLSRACAELCEGRETSLASLLVARGWLDVQQREHIQTQLDRERCRRIEAEAATLSLASQTPREKITRTLDSNLDLDLALQARERIVLRGLHSVGGIGEVWRAWDEVLEREIALKRLKPEQTDSADNRARFYREARITGQLEHPGIVPVYDYHGGEGSEHCYYTMRLLQGQTLRDVSRDFHSERAATGQPLVSGPFLDLLAKFASICHTIAYAHDRGVIHRDLKGENVLIGDFGEVVVLDWGLAKRLRRDDADTSSEGVESSEASVSSHGSLAGLPVTETLQGERLGTPAYMAPEQARGSIDDIDERTDVYGLAAILYELLTGRAPFSGPSAQIVMNAVIELPPVPPREHVPEVPLELEAICLRGLAKSKHARHAHVTELAAAVSAWLGTLAERRRAQQAREHFFELSLDPLAILDDEGRLRLHNGAWSRLLGWDARAMTHTPLARFVHEDDLELLAAKREALARGTGVVEFDLRLLRASGGHRWLHCRLRALPEEDGLYLVARDVTTRRRSEQLFMGLLESAPDATCVIDSEGVITLVNAQLERMFGYDRDEILGEHINVLVPADRRARHSEHVRRYVRAATSPRPMGSGLELEGQRKDGSRLRVQISLGPVRTETGTLITCAIRSEPY